MPAWFSGWLYPFRRFPVGFRTAQKELFLVSLVPFLWLLLGYSFTRSLAQRIGRIQEFSESRARGNFSPRERKSAQTSSASFPFL